MNNKTLELKKEVLRLYKKWTIIWLANILVYVVLSIIFAAIGWIGASLGTILGIILAVMSLNNHKSDIKDQMKDIKRLEVLDKRIDELRQVNQKLREKHE